MTQSNRRVAAIAVDIGGTFTDALAASSDGVVLGLAKVVTDTADPARGFMAALGEIARSCGTDLVDMLRGTGVVVHGTTLATNALLTGRTAKVGMLTTEGFRDQLESRRGQKNVNRSMFDVFVDPPRPLVPRRLRRPVSERIGPNGEIWIELDEEGVATEAAFLLEAGVEAIAVCFLHSYRDPAHEEAAAGIVTEAGLGRVYVSTSHAVAPIEGEYERFSTTVVNAALGPVLDGYLERLAASLADNGFEGLLAILRSDALVQTVAESRQRPVELVASGPAGAAAGASTFSRCVGALDFVSLEVGGTSTDVCFSTGGRLSQTSGQWVGSEYIAIKSLDVVSIGAGGGSIAHVNSIGLLEVGPQSAGASPGPACYGKGGAEPTVTDANLVLGYLDPSQPLGKIRLDLDAAKNAITSVAVALGMPIVEAASAVARTVSSHMSDRIVELATERGIDLRRDFALLAGGGAGPLHACAVAEEVGIDQILIPQTPGLLSAFGMLTGSLGTQLRSTGPGVVDDLDADTLRDLYEPLIEEARERMPDGAGEESITVGADLRYDGQYHDLELWFGESLDDVPSGKEIRSAFDAAHEAMHGFQVPGRRVLLLAPLVKVARPLLSITGRAPGRKSSEESRPIFVDGGWVDALVMGSEDAAGKVVVGPAVIHGVDSTILVRPAWICRPAEDGGFTMERQGLA